MDPSLHPTHDTPPQGRLEAIDINSFGVVCSFLTLRQHVALEGASPSLQRKARHPLSWTHCFSSASDWDSPALVPRISEVLRQGAPLR